MTAKPGSGDGFSINYFFEGEPNKLFEERIRNHLISLLPYFPFLNKFNLTIESLNTFPHSSGIASSASSMSSLALCICSIEASLSQSQPHPQPQPHPQSQSHPQTQPQTKPKLRPGKLQVPPLRQADFYRKASYMARLGSGSASRSVYGGFVSWGRISEDEYSSDEFATPFKNRIGDAFHELHDAIMIVSPMKKNVSSSQGHALMNNHPFASQRYNQSRNNMAGITKAIRDNDVEKFIQITENEALTLHGLMMSSDPGFILLEPSTLEILSRVRRFREESGTFLCFTLDAGPNVHLIYTGSVRDKILSFVREELLEFCHDRKWIDDRIGNGPYEF